MRKTIKHYFDFGNIGESVGDTLSSPQAWDVVRTNGEETPFYLPLRRREWIERCFQQTDLVLRAREILNIFADLGVRRIFSAGVGCAWLEYNLKHLSNDLNIVCGDYAPNTVARLRNVADEFDDIIQFDMATSEWPNGYDLFLLHRIDMELSNDVWERVFERMSSADAKYILFIPCGMLTLKSLAIELTTRVRAAMLRNQTVFSGYWRTRETFQALWEAHYDERGAVSINDLPGFILERSPSKC
jgi:hypothetical protein